MTRRSFIPSPIETERALMIRIRAELATIPGVRVFRNNVGVDTTRGVRYGLAVGSGDLIGLVNGRFVSLEVKKPGENPTEEQLAWQKTVRRFGGIAEVIRSVEEARAAVLR